MDRSVGGYEGLIAAQDCLPDNDTRDNLDTLVMDADVLESLLESREPGKKSKEIEIKLIARLRRHKSNPIFIALGERLEKLREKHEQGLLHSLDFLKELLMLAKDVLLAEKEVTPPNEQSKAKAALTELLAEVKNVLMPIVVERIVTDIDEIVRLVRFPGWQSTKAGEREVQRALRKVIYVKYRSKTKTCLTRLMAISGSTIDNSSITIKILRYMRREKRK